MLLADSLAGALLLMHTLGTVPYLRISDQTYHSRVVQYWESSVLQKFFGKVFLVTSNLFLEFHMQKHHVKLVELFVR